MKLLLLLIQFACLEPNSSDQEVFQCEKELTICVDTVIEESNYSPLESFIYCKDGV